MQEAWLLLGAHCLTSVWLSGLQKEVNADRTELVPFCINSLFILGLTWKTSLQDSHSLSLALLA